MSHALHLETLTAAYEPIKLAVSFHHEGLKRQNMHVFEFQVKETLKLTVLPFRMFGYAKG